MKQGEDFMFDEQAREPEEVHHEPIAAEDQIPHELMNAEAEVLQCKSLVVDASKGLMGTRVWVDGRELYVSRVSFDLSLEGVRASVSFMPRKLFLRWKGDDGKSHVQAVVDNRIEGSWPQERLAGHASLVFDEVGICRFCKKTKPIEKLGSCFECLRLVHESDDAGNPR